MSTNTPPAPAPDVEAIEQHKDEWLRRHETNSLWGAVNTLLALLQEARRELGEAREYTGSLEIDMTDATEQTATLRTLTVNQRDEIERLHTVQDTLRAELAEARRERDVAQAKYKAQCAGTMSDKRTIVGLRAELAEARREPDDVEKAVSATGRAKLEQGVPSPWERLNVQDSEIEKLLAAKAALLGALHDCCYMFEWCQARYGALLAEHGGTG